jgi:hypothetical protein
VGSSLAVRAGGPCTKRHLVPHGATLLGAKPARLAASPRHSGHEFIDQLAAGAIDVVAIASAPQVRRLFDVAIRRAPLTLTQSAGVPRRNGRYAGRIRMDVVPDRSAASRCGFVEAAVEPGVVVVTDAWGGHATLPDRGYRHLPVAAHGDPSVAEDFLPISHLIFSNLKSWLRGCHHGVSPQHLQAYLNEFTFRFNRRFYPFNGFRSLLWISRHAVAPASRAVCDQGPGFGFSRQYKTPRRVPEG